jgi:hypothetical protein
VMHDVVSARRDLPASLIAFAYATASPATRSAIEARLPTQLASRISRLAEIVGPASDAVAAPDKLEAHNVNPLKAPPSAGALLSLLVRGDKRGFLRGVVAITHVDGPALNRRLSNPDIDLVTLLAKACGFEQDTVPVIVDAFRPGVSWSRNDDRAVALNWMRHSKETARKTLLSTLSA